MSNTKPAAVAGGPRLGRWAPCWLAGLLVATVASAQPLAPAAAFGRTVELVLAESEHQARVVERAMQAEFFVDQLLIPKTRYVGRRSWSELPAGLQAALADSRPGEVAVLTGSKGVFMVARVLPESSQAILGETEYAQDPEKVWAVLSFGPTDLKLLSLEVDLETDDLGAVCRSKERLMDEQLRVARAQRAALPPSAPLPALIQTHAALTSALSLKGEMVEAIQAVEAFAERLSASGGPGGHQHVIDQFLGILELRRGEVENCLAEHNREMCLFPLSEAAQHRVGDGARRAVAHFTRFLERNPDNLEIRWLLNVAAMTAGTYPDGVPERFQIQPEAFASEVDPGRFWDVAGPAGLAYSDNAGGSVADDFDGDGLLDLVVSSRDPCEPLRFYRNRGDGIFEDATEAAGLAGQLGGLNVTQTDFDNDGRRDLYVMRGGWETAIRDSLLRNRPGPGGGVVFEDVTARAGLGGPAHRTHSAAWADYDNDGWQDLLAVTLLQSVDEVAREYLGLPPQGETLRIYRNRGDGSFEDTTAALGMERMIPTMGSNFGDIDGDGFLDMYLGTGAPSYGMLVPNRLFLNRGGREFVDVTTATGTGHLQKGHGVAFADFDNDGDQDIFSNMGGAFPGDKYTNALFENPGSGNHWIAIELVGTRSNRAAIGARIRLVLEEDGAETERVRWVSSGGSFGASPFMQHIGLGRASKIARVEIDWPVATGSPTERRQVLENVPLDSFVVVTEGAAGFELAERPRLVLGAGVAGNGAEHRH